MPESAAQNAPSKSIAIACGGTGGHLFPGVAVGEELRLRGCNVTLMISPKEVDQQAVRSISGMEIVTLPAVGLTRGAGIGFLWGFWKSYRAARKLSCTNPTAFPAAPTAGLLRWLMARLSIFHRRRPVCARDEWQWRECRCVRSSARR
jgi:hypothetical protein